MNTHKLNPAIASLLVVLIALSACTTPAPVPAGAEATTSDGDYIAASSFSRNGFARDAEQMRSLDGQEVRIWGYVDYGNMYGDEGAQQILGDWWSGDGPTATTWRFNLKANEDDEVGQSFAVHVPNDRGRDALLRTFLADARAGKPTKVYLRGKIFTFDAPTNASALTGLYMELGSSDDIRLELPEEQS